MLNELLKETGISSSQAEAIRVIETQQPLSLKDLGSLLICETGSPSRLVERMVKDELIEKIIHPEDSRFVLLRLTKKGEKIAEKVKIIEEKVYDLIEKMLTEKEIKATNDALRKFIQAFPVHKTLMDRGYL
ncbi:winged helix DNA-binding protein [Paenibacillus sediminis]|uniref:DNA-binding MarR family transcriptional regulator n=1 Tax=Paenibacillus sediminis TaxID=664909 RepID=A0ABS4H2X8_9BACL|nr:winged helix DNA-binding protein [Paenibacillus sediminis]MBP1936863.1 DNA-binding MarR family transcriptional regulator [Paenibacillus sediminis]